ncbi:MAG: YidC/Oxa1 family membrane protein insertase [Candidatus Kentron sp. G]|nr:MAG: YidC/Oxa1 family membrane protein insertase [Candidatus Kentron sp. G]VFN00721.1 MAG: YidC/Oxa1 family membrane protein insertase [Candidatus Kentron sp. G]VFN01084.1 MAG: YidC/Oxa1 family membrane protein insertase [Candidatus Kentron sp. G]
MPIEQIRTFLAISLLIVLFLLWQAWQEDYGRSLSVSGAPDRTGQSEYPGMAGPPRGDNIPGGNDIPFSPGDTSSPDNRMIPALPGADVSTGSASSSDGQSDSIRVRTDVFDLLIEPDGTGIYQLNLLAYPESQKAPDIPFQLLLRGLGNYFVAEAPLFGSDPALHQPPRFRAERYDYRLPEGEDTLEVRLFWDSGDGLGVVKVMTLRRGSYTVDVSYEITNAKEEPVAVRLHGKLTRYPPPGESGLFRLPTYTGGVVSNAADPYEKIDFSDMAEQDLNHTAQGGWIAMIQHYFIGSWIPDANAMNQYYTSKKNNLYTIGVSTDKIIPAGGRGTIGMRSYLGPKIQDDMEAVAPNLSRTVDYGWLWLISQPLFWLLQKIHAVVGNWGWAIIILTIIIKLAFFHLSATSYKSMAKMRKLQPRMLKLRDTYKDDKVKMNQRLMELYKQEGVNPLGGCLPIAVQIPFFIALYWVLLESVELRHAEFIFWLSDLSTHDPYFVLPLAMGLTMFLQQKLNPTPPDPVQAKVMMALPFVFTVLFLFFPAGLVLYWLVNNTLSIAQQWVITRRIAPDS